MFCSTLYIFGSTFSKGGKGGKGGYVKIVIFFAPLFLKVDIEFESPSTTGFTIYSKSGCPNCTNVKKLLQENKMESLVIDCDEYLVEEREKFIEFITELLGKEVKTFPLVFFDGKFVGGYKETKEHTDRMLVDFNF